MKIIETEIPDVTEENLDQSKVILADKIITEVYPLFDEIYNSKIQQLSELKREYRDKVQQIRDVKNELELMNEEYLKKKKLANLLNRVSKLVESGLTYDGGLKHEMIILLKVSDKLTLEKLQEKISEVATIVRKRFAR
jgi:hypothetical protein